MPQMQPAEALATCEQALRSLISTVLVKKLGKDWVSQVFSEERAVKIRGVREEESGRRTRRGVASVPSSELAYAQFFDILALLKKYWEDFKPALGNQSETLGLLSRFEALRNSVAHNRDLLPFEEELLSGIAGEIRNRCRVSPLVAQAAPDELRFFRCLRTVELPLSLTSVAFLYGLGPLESACRPAVRRRSWGLVRSAGAPAEASEALMRSSVRTALRDSWVRSQVVTARAIPETAPFRAVRARPVARGVSGACGAWGASPDAWGWAGGQPAGLLSTFEGPSTIHSELRQVLNRQRHLGCSHRMPDVRRG